MRRFPRGALLVVAPLVLPLGGLLAACVGDDPVVASSPAGEDGGSLPQGDGAVAAQDGATGSPDSSSPADAGADATKPG